ncbi:ATP-binding protein [Bordetella sp. 2513F-2]
MNSLKTRLFAALLATVLLSWIGWFGLQMVEMGRRQTGLWDAKLEDIAQKTLLTLPGPITPMAGEAFHLPSHMERNEDGQALQVWQRDAGQWRLALRSPEAPATPLDPAFTAGYTDAEHGGQAWRVYTLNDRDARVLIQVGHTRAQRHAQFRAWLAESLKATALLLAFLVVTVFCVLDRGLKRIDRARALMQQRDPFDLAPLPMNGVPDELHPLMQSVNQLLGRLDTALARERRLIGDAAHELRTPLAAITTQAELARGATQPEDRQSALDKLLQAARRATRLSEQLLDQARLDAMERLPTALVELAPVVAMVVRDYESYAREKGQHIRLDVQRCQVQGDVDALGMLVRNLVDNAVRYTPERGQITVRCGPQGDGRGAVLTVSDDGPGVPDGERARIFERFYRIQGSGVPGSGIGLSLVSQIARLHGAYVACTPGDGGDGLRVTVRFDAPPSEQT